MGITMHAAKMVMQIIGAHESPPRPRPRATRVDNPIDVYMDEDMSDSY
jgi:hypothetical protein